MKRIATLLAAAFLTVAAGPSLAQDQAAAARGKGNIAGARYTATVESIDQASRKVVLKGSQGNVMSFVASDEVRNLDQVSKGDTVTVDFVQAIAMRLAKTDAKERSRVVSEDLKRSAPGQMPGGVLTREVKIIASIEAVDVAKSLVTLKGPQHTVVMKVEDPVILKQVKAGDMVEATYLEGVSIKVEKAKK